MFVSAGEVSVKVRKRPQSVPGPRKKRHAGTFWGLFRARAGPGGGDYCFTNSTRRFLARPSSVELSAMGSREPLPTAVRRSLAMPN